MAGKQVPGVFDVRSTLDKRLHQISQLRGHVDSWSPASGAQFSLLPPDNATGNFTKVVQRIPVKIVLDRDQSLNDLLRPGMSVIATIDTSSSAVNSIPSPH